MPFSHHPVAQTLLVDRWVCSLTPIFLLEKKVLLAEEGQQESCWRPVVSEQEMQGSLFSAGPSRAPAQGHSR